MLDDNGVEIRLLKTGYTGPAPPGSPPRLPLLSFEITFPTANTKTTFYPYVALPSSDPSVNKAAFLDCIDYFLKTPNTYTHTEYLK